MKTFVWSAWIILSIALASYFSYRMFSSEDKSDFLIGEATHGHFQIEMACETCHSDAFGGEEALQNACVNCHAEELEEAHDSHPKKKFTDPREAYRIEILDARYCISCHTEHQAEQTRAMGVTLLDDYCYHCHQEVINDRPSHADLPFDSCASAGCHNFHDNRALYEKFLVKNANQPWLAEIAKIASPNSSSHMKKPTITLKNSAFTQRIAQHPDIAQHWQASSHAQSGVDCGGCHTAANDKNNKTQNIKETWIEKPGLDQCAQCHKPQTTSFTQGKHGMRLSPEVSNRLHPITPKESHLTFNADSSDIQHGCNSCHNAHTFNTQDAAVESCLGCHADTHSLAFNASPHGQKWQQELTGEIENGAAVSCATCHMPRITHSSNGTEVTTVQHNQNWNLRPNEKMIRSVCMNCHSLEFSIDALADPKLIENNFNGKPGIHIESIDWSLGRLNENAPK